MKQDNLETYSIGLKLRTLRIQKNLTLSRLANETGLSTALLSKLETNSMLPTLQTLARICRVYGIGLGYFFSDVEQHSLAITRRVHINQSRSQQTAKTTPLHVSQPDGRMSTAILEYPAGATTTIGEHEQRNEITAFVIEGALEIDVAGGREILEAGDCAVLDTSGLIVWTAREGSVCRVLVVKLRCESSRRQS